MTNTNSGSYMRPDKAGCVPCTGSGWNLEKPVSLGSAEVRNLTLNSLACKEKQKRLIRNNREAKNNKLQKICKNTKNVNKTSKTKKQ